MINETKKYNVLLSVMPLGMAMSHSTMPCVEISDIILGATATTFKLEHGGSIDFKYSDLCMALTSNVMGNNVVLSYQPSIQAMYHSHNAAYGNGSSQLNPTAMLEQQVVGLAFSPMTLKLVEPLRGAVKDPDYKYGQAPKANESEEIPWILFEKPFGINIGTQQLPTVGRFSMGHPGGYTLDIRGYRHPKPGHLEVLLNHGSEITSYYSLKEKLQVGLNRSEYEEEHREFLTAIMSAGQPQHEGEVITFDKPLLIGSGPSQVKVTGYSRYGETMVLDSLVTRFGLPDFLERHKMMTSSLASTLLAVGFQAEPEHRHFVYDVVGYKDPVTTNKLANPMLISSDAVKPAFAITGWLQTEQGMYLDVRSPYGDHTTQIVIGDPEDVKEHFNGTLRLAYMDEGDDHMQVYRALFNREPVPIDKQFKSVESGDFPTSLTVWANGEKHKLRGWRSYAEGIVLIHQNGYEKFITIGGKDKVEFVSATATLQKMHPERIDYFIAILAHINK